jgi:hypothetical protein
MFSYTPDTAAAAWNSMLRRQLQERLGREVQDSPQHARTGRDRSTNTIHNSIPIDSLSVTQHDPGGQISSSIGVAGRNAFTGTSPPPGYPPPTDYHFPPGYRPRLVYPPPPGYAYDLSNRVLIQGFQLAPDNLIPVRAGPLPVSTINVATDRSRDLGQEVTQSGQ